MASYQVELRRPAEKDLRGIQASAVARLASAIDRLAEDPRPHGSRRLAGRESQYRLRLGDYRVLYTVDDSQRLVIVYNIRHRREAYRR